MTISMYKVMLKQHREKCFRSYIRYNFIQIMNIFLIETDSFSIYELFNQNLISRLFVGSWKSNISIYINFIESIYVFILLQKR